MLSDLRNWWCRMRFTRVVALLAVIAGATVHLACQNTAKIGVIAPLTGSQAAFGEAHKNGYLLALDEINARGGVLGKKIELDLYDDQGKPDQAVQGISKLVDQDHVTIVLGSYSSETTKAILPAVTQRQVPLIIPTATADNLMESQSPWVFRICASTADYAQAITAFLKANGAPRTMAIVYENTNFGQSTLKAMTPVAQAAGIQLVTTEAYEAKSPDYRSVLQRVKKANPDVIYFASYLLDATTLMRQAREIDLNPKYYTAASAGFATAEFPTPKGAGKNAEYTFSAAQWVPGARWPGSKEFDAEYFKRYNSHPAYHAIEAYVALNIVVRAMKDAESLDAVKIRDAIKNMNLSMTPFGPIKFDGNGQNPHPVMITQVQDGQYRVVYPPDAADAKPVIPTPAWSLR
jgi:branched-chain amino acid transport system substrate-binding protein